MSCKFKAMYIPVGVPTFHLESAQAQLDASIAMLKTIDADFIVPDKMLLSLADLNAYLESSRLRSVGSSIACETWLSVSNLKNSLNWNFSSEDCICSCIDTYLYTVTFLQELNTFDEVCWDVDLLKSLVVHEYEVCTFLI